MEDMVNHTPAQETMLVLESLWSKPKDLAKQSKSTSKAPLAADMEWNENSEWLPKCWGFMVHMNIEMS